MVRGSRSASPRHEPATGGRAAAGLDSLAQRLTAGARQLGAHAGGLYVLGSDQEVLDLAMMLGVPREFVEPWERVGLAAPVPVADSVRGRGLVWVGGEDEMVRRYPQVAVALPYSFCLAAVPLAVAGTTYGVVFLLWSAAHSTELTEAERDRLTEVADDLAGELAEATGAGRPVRAGRNPLMITPDQPGAGMSETLSAMVARLPEGVCALDLRGRLTWVTPHAAELLGVPAPQLVGAQPWVTLPWLRDPVYEDRYRAAVVSQQPSAFVALRPPDRWLSFELHPDVSGLTVRITAAEVSRQDALALSSVADPAVPTRAGALYHLLQLASSLTEAVGVQDVVDLVADQIVPAFRGKGVAILAVDGGRLRIVGHRGYPPGIVDDFDGTSLTAPTPGVEALMTGVPTFIGSREELERLYPARPELQDVMSAWAYLPLVASGRLIGTCVLAFAEPHTFTADERASLTSVGGLIAQALDRARLYDTKLELARGLQESLLPHVLPRMPGLEAAARYLPGTDGMEIGGDFYDVIRVDDHIAGAVIGDVQGHNVAAAVLMGQVRTAVRAYATAGSDPRSVLSRTNRLMADLDTGLLTSCAYLSIDLHGRQAWLATAGHPLPLLREPGGRVHVVDAAGGVLLGVGPTAQYPLTRIPLPVGTVMALYTDGLIESPGVDLDEALAELATRLALFEGESLEELADTLIHHAEQAKHRTDDIALLLLRSAPS